MKKIKVVFRDNAGLGNEFTGIFKNWSALEKFLEKFEHYGEILQFTYDVIMADCEEELPYLNTSFSAFKQLHNHLMKG